MSVYSDVSELFFQTKGVQSVVADFQKMENAARHFEQVQANAYYAPSAANSQALRDALRTQEFSAAQRAAGIAVAAISLLKEEVSLVKEAIDSYVQYGRTVQNIQALSGASLGSSEKFANLARVAGVPDQQAVREIMALSKDMFSAKGQSALSRLGISSQGKDAIQVFEAATAAISKMQAGAARTNIEMQLFNGRLTLGLQPFLHMSDEVKRRTDELSNTFDGRALQAINNFQGSVNLLGLTLLKDLVFPLADAVLPAITWVVLEFQAGVEWIRKLDESVHGALKWAAIFLGAATAIGTLTVAAKGLYAAYLLVNSSLVVQDGLLALKAILTDNIPKVLGAAAVATIAIGAGYYFNQNNDNKTNDASDTLNNAANTMQQGAATFAGAVNGLARSLSSIAGSEISGNMTEADLALTLQRAAQGLG